MNAGGDFQKIRSRIFAGPGPGEYNALALEIFSFQYCSNPVYRKFCDLLKKNPETVTDPAELPFLPVELFKTQKIRSLEATEKMVFRSSGTVSGAVSSHFIYDPLLYEESILRGFTRFYGSPEQYCFALLMPTPQEKPDSSLVYMGNVLIRASGCTDSGFYLDRLQDIPVIPSLRHGKRLFMLGLSFAILEAAEKKYRVPADSIVVETGGMKGRRRETTRETLHGWLTAGLGVNEIHSEYSMCELFSQAWSTGKGIFEPPPWMRVLIRDRYNPLAVSENPCVGGLNIIDLANLATCSFIATGDYGELMPGGRFTVCGRMTGSEVKGCSLMFDEPQDQDQPPQM